LLHSWLSHSGFFSSFVTFCTLNVLFPVPGCGDTDEIDIYGTFTEEEARKMGVVHADVLSVDEKVSQGEQKRTSETK
jgi:nucleobase:cation symporter-1, NCS1 family